VLALLVALLGLLADPQPAITRTPDTTTTAIASDGESGES
jgi:hypothetical protein